LACGNVKFYGLNGFYLFVYVVVINKFTLFILESRSLVYDILEGHLLLRNSKTGIFTIYWVGSIRMICDFSDQRRAEWWCDKMIYFIVDVGLLLKMFFHILCLKNFNLFSFCLWQGRFPLRTTISTIHDLRRYLGFFLTLQYLIMFLRYLLGTFWFLNHTNGCWLFNIINVN